MHVGYVKFINDFGRKKLINDVGR